METKPSFCRLKVNVDKSFKSIPQRETDQKHPTKTETEINRCRSNSIEQ